MESHEKCYCKTCGKACNTPCTLERHMYSHRDNLPFPCTDCDAKFAFAGQLKQHRFKHCKVATFACSKCLKHYMREGKLVKHVKTHDNINYRCSKSKYTMLDPCNLKQHQCIHTDELPYMCPQCYKQFHFWMQKKRHKCEPPVASTDTSSDLHFWYQHMLPTIMYSTGSEHKNMLQPIIPCVRNIRDKC